MGTSSLNLRELLEDSVGLRTFYVDLPSRVAEMLAYAEVLGGCLAINRKHPEERRRLSPAHGYAHFLANRYRPEVAVTAKKPAGCCDQAPGSAPSRTPKGRGETERTGCTGCTG